LASVKGVSRVAAARVTWPVSEAETPAIDAWAVTVPESPACTPSVVVRFFFGSLFGSAAITNGSSVTRRYPRPRVKVPSAETFSLPLVEMLTGPRSGTDRSRGNDADTPFWNLSPKIRAGWRPGWLGLASM